MSQQNVEIVKRAHPASGTELTRLFADDSEAPARLEAAAPLYHPEFEFSAPTLGGVGFRRDGIEVTNRIALVWTFRDGAIVRICLYQQKQAALEAAGVSE